MSLDTKVRRSPSVQFDEPAAARGLPFTVSRGAVRVLGLPFTVSRGAVRVLGRISRWLSFCLIIGVLACSKDSRSHHLRRPINGSEQTAWRGRLTKVNLVVKVTLDGAPVRNYTLSIGTYPITARSESPYEVNANDGSLRLAIPAGLYDIAVAGPTFAREVRFREQVYISEMRHIEIRVSHGRTITGVLKDQVGRGVSGGIVRIVEAGPWRPEASTSWNRLVGNIETKTDADGRFRFDELSSSASGSFVTAESEDGKLMSAPQFLPPVQPETIDVELQEVAVLGGRVSSRSREDLFVARSVNGSRIYTGEVDGEGRVTFRLLPGEYDIERHRLDGGRLERIRRVSVVGGTRTDIALE